MPAAGWPVKIHVRLIDESAVLSQDRPAGYRLSQSSRRARVRLRDRGRSHMVMADWLAWRRSRLVC